MIKSIINYFFTENKTNQNILNKKDLSKKDLSKKDLSKEDLNKEDLNNISNDNISVNTFNYTIIPQNFNNILFNHKKNIGFCFSGGGPRSCCATLGYIRALHQMNILKDVKYISCVSGSTWTWIPYTYLSKDYDEEIFIGLDKFKNLDTKLDIKMVEYIDSKYFGNSLVSLASNTQLIEYIYEGFKHMGYGERTRIWPYMLGKIFLEPYDILDTKFFAPNQNIVDIFHANPLNLTEEFKIPYNDDRPFIISNSSIVRPDKKGTLINTDFDLLVMTPLYSGTLAVLKDKDGSFGGNYSNTYSFHPLSYEEQSNNISIAKVNIPLMHSLDDINRFNLFDMMGSSSAAYGIVTELIGLTVVNPSYRLVDREMNKVKYFDCVDGGILDNVGILPMLQNQVKNIVLFINSNNIIMVDKDDIKMTRSIEIALRQLFLGDENVDKQKYFHYFEYINNLKVFDNKDNIRWKELLDKMRKNIIENDIAYVEMDDLKVLKNDNFHVKEYKIDKLLIIYLYKSKDWTQNRLNEDVQKLIQTYYYKDFPYYDTIFENSGWFNKELLQLTASEVNLLSDLCHWNVIKNSLINEGIKNLFK